MSSSPTSSISPTEPARTPGALSFRQLAYLVALSETLNFTRAADRCFVTQSTLSAGIRELEGELGNALFERDRQSVRITPLGRELAGRARLLLSQAMDFLGAARAAAHPLEGTLTLGAIPTIAPFLLPRLLRRLRRSLPRLTTLLREERTEELLHAVEEGEIDAAIIALPMDVGRLHVLPLFEEELWLIAAEDDPVARQASLAIAQVDMERLMLLSEGHCLREHALEACRRDRHLRRKSPSAIEASSLPTLIQMVEANLGVSLLPEMAIKAGILVGTKVIARPLAAPAPRRGIVLVARPTSSRGPLLERIAELAIETGTERLAKGPRHNKA